MRETDILVDGQRMFTNVLIANRGEIACRVIRACQAQGIRAIAVYSDADANAMHTRLADAAYNIGPAPARDSYLNIEAIVLAARKAHAQAIHPGYGFLAESAAAPGRRSCQSGRPRRHRGGPGCPPGYSPTGAGKCVLQRSGGREAGCLPWAG